MKAAFESTGLLVDIESEAEMDALGRLLAQVLQSGDVVCLNGPLGAGKTRLVRAFADALDCEQAWAGSPTFILVQEYEGRLPVYHMDAYRLKGSQEFRELGGEDYLWGEGVCLIEWAERIADVLPADALYVTIRVVSPTGRHLQMKAGGGRSHELLIGIANALGAGGG